MPLFKGKKNIGKNIATEMAHGKPRKQAIAIAMSVAGKKSKGKMDCPTCHGKGKVNKGSY